MTSEQTAQYQATIPPTQPLDWDPELTEEQWAQIEAQYRSGHSFGMDNLEAVDRYVLFSHEYRPDALKTFKNWVYAVAGGRGLDQPVPGLIAGALVMLHYYCVIRYPQGIRYETNGPRALGIKKSEIADIVALAWLSGGPFGINSAATVLYDFMQEWDDSDAPGWKWPAGWVHDPDAFTSGIDFAQSNDEKRISAQDLEKLELWHRRVEGGVPSYVPFLAKHYPLALLAFRHRMEATLAHGSLPKQYVALAWVHLAASWWRPEALQRAIHMARVFGVTKDQVIHIIGLTQVYQGHVGMDAVVDAVGGALDQWDLARA